MPCGRALLGCLRGITPRRVITYPPLRGTMVALPSKEGRWGQPEVLEIEFPGNRFTGTILSELRWLVERGLVASVLSDEEFTAAKAKLLA